MTIIHERVKLRYARIYEPELTSFDGKPHPYPRFSVGFFAEDNPDRPELPFRPAYRDPSVIRGFYNTTARPRVTLRDGDYETLIKTLDVFRARNILPDVLFRGAYADIVINEYPKHDETILQLSELVFETIEVLNIDGDIE